MTVALCCVNGRAIQIDLHMNASPANISNSDEHFIKNFTRITSTHNNGKCENSAQNIHSIVVQNYEGVGTVCWWEAFV